MIHFEQKEYKGFRIKVEVTGFIEEYALKFYKIYNHVKNHSRFVKVYTDSEDNVVVVCDENYKDRALKWLSTYGEIIEVAPVTVIEPSVDAEVCGINEADHEITETEIK
ncbi:MAG: hypothetical protein E7235_02640, partial [Lachnospiraceae bacterium]|nr:hypothetical protein [Lachnospiraceae bacterium]